MVESGAKGRGRSGAPGDHAVSSAQLKQEQASAKKRRPASAHPWRRPFCDNALLASLEEAMQKSRAHLLSNC